MGTSPSPVFLSVKCIYHTMLMVTGISHNLHSSQKHTQEHSEHNKAQTKEAVFCFVLLFFFKIKQVSGRNLAFRWHLNLGVS